MTGNPTSSPHPNRAPLAGKVALVTGGSRGIGAATARTLAGQGADIAISHRCSPDAAASVVARSRELGVHAAAYGANQAEPDQVRGLVERVSADFGRLDILVNNAAAHTTRRLDDPDVDRAALDRLYDVNIDGVVAAIRAAARILPDGGRIVTVGSMQADRTGFPGVADYIATKSAIVGYSKGAARDLGPRGITVNVVQPGSTATEMNPDDAPFADVQRAANALGRFAEPAEIAAGIAFLAGPAASFITGTVLTIDGGYLS